MAEVDPLEAALAFMASQMNEDTASQIRAATDEDVVLMHHGLGTWIRNNLGLWRGSPLGDFLADEGFAEPDDMSTGVIYALRGYLRGESYLADLAAAPRPT